MDDPDIEENQPDPINCPSNPSSPDTNVTFLIFIPKSNKTIRQAIVDIKLLTGLGRTYTSINNELENRIKNLVIDDRGRVYGINHQDKRELWDKFLPSDKHKYIWINSEIKSGQLPENDIAIRHNWDTIKGSGIQGIDLYNKLSLLMNAGNQNMG